LALHIAASAPRYLKVEDIPADVMEREAEIARVRAKEEGKPENILDKIVQGRLEKFKDEAVLSRQAYVRDETITVEKLILENVAAIGENVIVRRFQRWELGESLQD
jgi:elongation factor Ts